jgi:thymidine kinase
LPGLVDQDYKIEYKISEYKQINNNGSLWGCLCRIKGFENSDFQIGSEYEENIGKKKKDVENQTARQLVQYFLKMKSGYINLIIGPMFSGKTTGLLNVLRKQIDKKKDNESRTVFVCHPYTSNEKRPYLIHSDKKCIQEYPFKIIESEKLDTELFLKLLNYDIIGIDEGQFFNGISKFLSRLVRWDKLIFVAGLSGDYKQRPFDEISNLISISDSIEFKRAICLKCEKLAPFSHKKDNENGERIILGGSETYSSYCRKCLSNRNILVKIGNQ